MFKLRYNTEQFYSWRHTFYIIAVVESDAVYHMYYKAPETFVVQLQK